jgi:coenzyme F420-dependent glucose-6-phosphate dehydrogenase
MKLRIGYDCCMELYHPNVFLELAPLAEKAGFDTIWASDHFHPWQDTNASSCFTWAWIAAAADRTKKAPIGTAVTCPMFRYHPAIVAQAFATLRAMYPERIFVGLGTGEGLNEVPLGFTWPSVKERIERFEESIKIMRKLWTEEWVDFKGKYYRLKQAKLYVKPTTPVPIYVASFGPKVAEIAGKYADGYITTLVSEDHLRNVLIPAVERGAKQMGRDPSKIERTIELGLSYDRDYAKALKKVRFWAGTMFPVTFKYGMADPREIEAMGNLVGDEQVAKAFAIGTKAEDFIERIEKLAKAGFNHIYLQSTSPDEKAFIELCANEIIPYVKDTYRG